MSEPQSEPDGAPAPLMEPLLAVHSAPNASWLSDAAVNAAERGIGALYAFLYLIDASGSLSGEPPASGGAARALTKVRQILNVDPTTIKLRPEEHPVIATTIAEGRGAVVANLEEVLPLDMDAGALTAAQLLLGFAEVWLVPVAWASEALGLLMLLVPPQAPASVAQAELLGRHVGLALKNIREREAGRKRGELDAVRWIYDEERLREELEQESRRARRHGRPLSILLVRVEGFDALQGRYGRFLAEQVLRQVAARLDDAKRDTDFLGASGENGFVAILVEADADGAARAEERLIAGLEAMELPRTDLPDLDLRLACATATQPEDGEDAAALLASGEARLRDWTVGQEEAASA